MLQAIQIILKKLWSIFSSCLSYRLRYLPHVSMLQKIPKIIVKIYYNCKIVHCTNQQLIKCTSSNPPNAHENFQTIFFLLVVLSTTPYLINCHFIIRLIRNSWSIVSPFNQLRDWCWFFNSWGKTPCQSTLIKRD